MPFTPAHPLAVLPWWRTRLPLSALVVGSMVPDVPVFSRSADTYALTHGPLGIVTIDVVLGVAALVLWFVVLREPLADLAPGPVRARVEPRARLARSRWPWVVPAIVVGALTHVAWDEMTHPGRWGARHVAWLAELHGPMAGALWLQYTSGVVGTLAVVAVALRVVLRRPARSRGPRLLPGGTAYGMAVVAVAVGLASVVAHRDDGLLSMAFFGVVHSMVTGAAAVAGVAALWHVVARARQGREKRQRGLGG